MESTVTTLVSRYCLRCISQFNYGRYVNNLCLGGGYVVFHFRLARLFGNDEINEDARKILNFYVAGEHKSLRIPLLDGIPVDLRAKEPVSRPRSPLMDLWNYISQGRLIKRKHKPWWLIYITAILFISWYFFIFPMNGLRKTQKHSPYLGKCVKAIMLTWINITLYSNLTIIILHLIYWHISFSIFLCDSWLYLTYTREAKENPNIHLLMGNK